MPSEQAALLPAQQQKMQRLQKACHSLQELLGDDDKTHRRWVNEVETYFREFRVSVVHCQKDPPLVLESPSEEEKQRAWEFLTKLSKDRGPYATRCEEVLHILMLSPKWLEAFKEKGYTVEDLPPTIQGQFAEKLEAVGGQKRPEIAFRLECAHPARLAALRALLEDVNRESVTKLAESADAQDLTLGWTPWDHSGGRCLCAALPRSAGSASSASSASGASDRASAAASLEGVEALNVADFWPQFLEAQKLDFGTARSIDARIQAEDPFDAPVVAAMTLVLRWGGPVAKVEALQCRPAGFTATVAHEDGCVSVVRGVASEADGLDAPKAIAPFVVISAEKGEIAFDHGKIITQRAGSTTVDERSCGGLAAATREALRAVEARLQRPEAFDPALLKLLFAIREQTYPSKAPPTSS